MSNIKLIIITFSFLLVLFIFHHHLKIKEIFHRKYLHNPDKNTIKIGWNHEIRNKSEECTGLNFELSYNLRWALYWNELSIKKPLSLSSTTIRKRVKKNLTRTESGSSKCVEPVRLEFINNVTISEYEKGVIMLETSGKSRFIAK